jgi:hypothetical protein
MEPDKNTSPAPEDEAPKDEQSSSVETDTSDEPETQPDTGESHDSPEQAPASSEEDNGPSTEQDAPADALSMTPDELEEAEKESGKETAKAEAEEAEKQLPFIKRVFRKVNVYFLGFILIVIIAGAIAAVTYFNSQKPPESPDVAGQTLTSEALKQLANTDASVGNTSQTLTIQGNAIIAGETLTRGNLNVAGNLQTGGDITTPNITVSGNANLGATQINDLQVATNTSIQGSTTLRDLNVSGTSSFGGAMTASQITVTRLILSGNAVLEVPNHISFTGTAPKRSINSSVLGSGGTLSLNGSDTAGTIKINTGNNTSAGCFAQITFQQAYTKEPRVIVSPVGSSAAQTQYYVDRNTTSFSICTLNAAPTNRSFAFDYFVTN